MRENTKKQKRKNRRREGKKRKIITTYGVNTTNCKRSSCDGKFAFQLPAARSRHDIDHVLVTIT